MPTIEIDKPKPARNVWPTDKLERRAQALARVEAVADRLAAEVQASETDRRISKASVEALLEAGVLGIMTPDDVGGNVLDPVSAFLVIERIGRIDPALAWTATILLEGACSLATYLPAERVSAVFGGPRLPLKAGSLRPGTAVPADGGYRLNGTWDFASGIHHSDFVSAAFWITEPTTGATERRAALIPTDEVTILDDWRTLGMRGTGSTSFALDDQFVPTAMVFNPFDGPVRHDTPLARLGMTPFVLQMHQGMALGAARRALDELMVLAATRRPGSRINTEIRPTLAEETWFQREIGELDARVRAARAWSMATLEELDAVTSTGMPVELQLLDLLQTCSSHAAKTAAEVVGRAFRHAGSAAISDSNIFQKVLRDINTICAHAVLGEVGFEMHGEFLLGLQTPENRRMV